MDVKSKVNELSARFKSRIPSERRKLIPLIIITAAIPLTILLALTQQDIRNRAAGLPATPAIPTSIPTSIPNPPQNTFNGNVGVSASGEISVLNSQIQNQVNSGNKSAASQLVEKRKNLMLTYAKTDRSKFLSSVMSDTLRNSLSEDVRKNIEEKVSIEGNLLVIYIDNFQKKESKILYKLEVNEGGELKLYRISSNASPSERLTSGAKVRLNGYRIDNQLVLLSNDINKDDSNFTSTPPTKAAATSRKIFVLPVNFSDNRSEPYSTTTIRDRFFGSGYSSLKTYYSTLSKSSLSLSGTVVSWKNLSMKQDEVCTDEGQDSLYKAARAHPSYNSTYKSVAFVFPRSDCDWSGMGTTGGNPGVMWLNFFDLPTMSHEFGHNLGIAHANQQHCRSGVGCYEEEYGDESDAMGFDFALMNALHRLSLNFLNSSQVKTFSGNGNYNLRITGGSSNPQIIKLPDRSGSWATYLTYIGPKAGYDSNIPYPTTNGAFVFRWNGDPERQTILIDLTPNDSDPYNVTLVNEQTISRPPYTIKQTSRGSTSVNFYITKN